MRRVLSTALMALAVALLLGPTAPAQMRGNNSSQHESGATACSGHGNTNFDRCFCDPGWTGPQCATQEREPNCGDHGKAWYGQCRCQAGWKGALCDTPPLSCTPHGKADRGKCVCDEGWSGADCGDRL
jgi:hypothetical protein